MFIQFKGKDGEIFIRSESITAVVPNDAHGSKTRIDVSCDSYYVMETAERVMGMIATAEAKWEAKDASDSH